MAQVPIYDPKLNDLSERVPTVTVPDQGVTSEYHALGQLGQDISNTANNMARQRIQQQAVDFETTKGFLAARDYDEYDKQMRLQMPSDYEGYTKAMTDWVSDRFMKDQDEAPSEAARQAYVQKVTGGVFGPNLIKAQALENQMRTQSAVTGTSELVDQMATQAVQTGDPSSALFAHDTLEDRITKQQGVLYDENKGNEIRAEGQSTISNALMQGMLNKGRNKEALALLNSDYSKNPDAKDPIAGMSPKDRGQWIAKFESSSAADSAINKADFANHAQDTLAALRSGAPAQSASLLRRKADELVASGDMTADSRARLEAQINTAAAVGGVSGVLKTAPASKMEAIIDGAVNRSKASTNAFKQGLDGTVFANDPNFGAGDRAEQATLAKSEAAKILKARSDDPAGYILSQTPQGKRWSVDLATNDPVRVQNAIGQMKAFQDQLEIPHQDQRILSDAQAKQLSYNIQSAPSTTSAQTITQITKTYGKYAPEVISQLVKDETLSNAYQTVGHITDEQLQSQAVSAIRNSKAVGQDFEQSTNKNTHTMLKDSVNQLMTAVHQDYTASQNSGDREQLFNDTRNMVMTKAQQYLVDNPHMTAQDAAKRAYDNFIGQTYYTSRAGGSTNLVPKVINGKQMDVDKIDAFKSSHLDPGVLTLKYQAQIPQGPSFSKLSSDDQMVAWQNQLKQAKWISNPSQTGLQLVYDDPKRGRTPILGPDQKPIQASYYDITTNPDASTLEAKKGKLEKLQEMVLGKPKAKP